MDDIKLVYLDSNVLIALCDRRDEDLRSKIESSMAAGRLLYPFAAEHIGEITAYPPRERDEQRLGDLSRLSRNLHLLNSATDFGLVIRYPTDVYDTINEVQTPLAGHEILESIAPFEQRRACPDVLGLSSNELNNLSGRQAMAVVDKALATAASPGSDAPRTMRQLVQHTKRFVSSPTPLFGKPSSAKAAVEERSQDICILFSLFDSFGLWRDDERAARRGSGFVDGRHVFNASFCHVLVSADKNMRGKAEAVYDVLGFSTVVMSIDDFRIACDASIRSGSEP